MRLCYGLSQRHGRDQRRSWKGMRGCGSMGQLQEVGLCREQCDKECKGVEYAYIGKSKNTQFVSRVKNKASKDL